MSEHNQKMNTRSSSKPAYTKPQNPVIQKQQQSTKNKQKNQGIKKLPGQKSLFTMGFTKQEIQIVPQPKQVLYSVKQLLKQTSFSQILQKCPKVKDFCDMLCSKSFISQKLVYSCLDKYFHGNTTSLWYTKYAPRQLNELFQADFAEKIQQWIKDFYYFKKQTHVDDQLSFIDDQPSQSYQKSLQNRMNQYGWNCKALILRGRNGVGKTSLLNAIAKSMKIRCFQYASDVDQLQKMKQLVDGSNSQAISNYHHKKKQQQNNKIIMENNPITRFIHQKQNKKQELETKQPKRLQIFRNFTQYFPPTDKNDKDKLGAQDNYYRWLFSSIEKYPIPYVLTSNKLEFSFREKSFNQKFSKFDQIQFIENTIEDLTYLYWTIYQIQMNLCLNNSKKIKKQGLFDELNLQFNSLNFQCSNVLESIRQLVVAANKKPLYISKYLQFQIHMKRQTSKKMIQNQVQNIKDYSMGEINYFNQAIKQVSIEITQNVNNEDLINNIQWVLYNKPQQSLSPLEQTAADQSQKQQKIEKTATKQQQIIQQKKPSIKQLRRQLDLAVIQNCHTLQNDPLNFKHNTQKNSDYFLNIPINIHIQAKKQILKNVRNRIKEQRQKKTYFNLNEKQMYYLPLFFPQRRSLRKQSRQPIQQNLEKIFNQRQIVYMQKFGKFMVTS